MREYYLLYKNGDDRWKILNAENLHTREAAYVHLNKVQVHNPFCKYLIGHEDDYGVLVIADKFNDIPVD